MSISRERKAILEERNRLIVQMTKDGYYPIDIIGMLKNEYTISASIIQRVIREHDLEITNGEIRKNRLKIEERNRKILGYYYMGYSYQQIADKMEITKTIVQGVIYRYRKLHKDMRKPINRDKMIRDNKIKQDYSDGMSVYDLMDKYYLSEPAIRHILKDCVESETIRNNNENYNNVVNLYSRYYSAHYISAKLDIPLKEVRTIIARYRRQMNKKKGVD